MCLSHDRPNAGKNYFFKKHVFCINLLSQMTDNHVSNWQFAVIDCRQQVLAFISWNESNSFTLFLYKNSIIIETKMPPKITGNQGKLRMRLYQI